MKITYQRDYQTVKGDSIKIGECELVDGLKFPKIELQIQLEKRKALGIYGNGHGKKTEYINKYTITIINYDIDKKLDYERRDSSCVFSFYPQEHANIIKDFLGKKDKCKINISDDKITVYFESSTIV